MDIDPYIPKPCQVQRFWVLMAVQGMELKPSKVVVHADAWGIRKLISHALRTLRLQRAPRETWMTCS